MIHNVQCVPSLWLFHILSQTVTYQKLGVQILRKFKTFLFDLECYQFSTQIASPSLSSPPIKPIYKNINSNYGKTGELEFFWFYLDFI
jgi:hypothetical protein